MENITENYGMCKIFFDEDGWVCDREPLTFQVTDETRFIDLGHDELMRSFEELPHMHAFRIVNNKLVIEKYSKNLTTDELEKIKCDLRQRRRVECFKFIDRPLWLETLPEQQRQELRHWYRAWLDAPTTLQVPEKPYGLV